MNKEFSREKRNLGKKNFEGGGRFNKKSFSDKPTNDSGEGFKKKPFQKNFKKPFYKKDFSRKRDDEKGDDSRRKSFSDKKPFQKSFKKPFYKKEFGQRRDDERNGEFKQKSFGDKKPFQKSFKKPFYKKEFGQRRDDERGGEFKPKPFGDKKPFYKKSFGQKRYDEGVGGKYKKKSFGNKSFYRKPFRKNLTPLKESVKNDSGLTRLNKYIANAGICSRREADELIKNGLVTVNGKVVTEMGHKVSADDEIRYGGDLLKREKNVYVLLNKPKDYITTTDDEQGRRNVLELVRAACSERIYPVGRLDRNTTGVLLFTNDGELTKKLTHPKHGVKKVYHVSLETNLSHQDMQKIAEGVELEDGTIKADEINYADPVSKKEIGIEIHSGRNRIIRRVFEQLGYNVIKLDRVVFAGLTKKNVQRGRWRFLTDKEVSYLKMLG